MPDEEPDSLRYQPHDPGDLNTLRQIQDDFLKDVDKSVDIDKLSAFAPSGKIDIGDLAGRLTPDSGSGLQLSADLDKLGEELRKVREQEANAKLARLLELAQRKIEQSRYRTAITLLDQALAVDPTSAPAWLLKGQCYFLLKEFRTALDLLATAREHARDRETVMLVLIMRAACERELAQAIELELRELLDGGRLDEARTLVERALRERPDSPVLLVHRCGILYLMGRFEEAKVAAESARAVAGERNAAIFDELLRRIALRESTELFESARLSLRRRDPKGALRQLDACPVALRGHRQFDALRAYAYERAGGSGRTVRRLLGHIGLARTRGADIQPIDDAERQSLLGWLLHEELVAGVEALNQNDFITATRSFEDAENIDARCTIVAFLHAVTIMGELQRAARSSSPNLNRTVESLQRAARLANQAAHDPEMREQGLKLAEVIDGNLRELEKVRHVTQLYSRFNSHMTYYQRNPIRSVAQLPHARRQFQSIRSDVQKARRGYPPGSAEHERLNELDTAISLVLAQLS